MNEVVKALEGEMGESVGELPESAPMRAAAKVWAAWALENLVGERLTRALSVSAAMAEYAALDDKS